MPSKSTIKIEPHVLTFLRKSAGYTEDDVASNMKISKDRFEKIESGNESLSMAQIVHLADLYERPLVAFFTKEVPEKKEMPHDYRMNRDKRLSPKIFIAKRKALYLAGQLKETSGNRSTELPVMANILSPAAMAEKLRKHLGITLNDTKGLVAEDILVLYKRQIEERFFVPVIEYPLKASGVRAFSVYSDISVIVLNESDIYSVKLFSLFHELCHLLKHDEGICNIELEKAKKAAPVERFCDEFAAHFLVPDKALEEELLQAQTLDLNEVRRIARVFGVSNLVILIRLLDADFISKEIYRRLKKELDEQPAKKGFGRRNWQKTYVNRTSRLILNSLIRSYRSGDLTYTSLATITGIKDKYLQQIV